MGYLYLTDAATALRYVEKYVPGGEDVPTLEQAKLSPAAVSLSLHTGEDRAVKHTIRLGKRTDRRSPLIRDFVPLATLEDIEFAAIDPDDGLLMAPALALPRLLKRNEWTYTEREV